MRDVSWAQELWRFVFVLGVGLLVGLLVDQVYPAVLLFVATYVIRHLYNIQRLIRWLDAPAATELPANFGLWSEIYARISRLLKIHADREQRLSALLAQFQSTAAALPDAVVALGPGDEIQWMNDAAERLLGLRVPGDYGRPLANLFRAPEFQHYLAVREFSHALELAAPGQEQKRLLLRAVPYGDRQLLVIAQDTTERYRVERIRRDFVANVSHELRTPLTVISGFIENMHADGDRCPEAWRRPLELIAGQADRMQHIVEALPLLARLEGGEKVLRHELVDVAGMLEAAAEETRLLTGGRCR